jgi:hypothetical protein
LLFKRSAHLKNKSLRLLILLFISSSTPMRNRTYRANIFANQTSNNTRCIHRNGIKGADETSIVRTDGYASATIDAGIPTDLKNDGGAFTHVCNLLLGLYQNVAFPHPRPVPLKGKAFTPATFRYTPVELYFLKF